MIIAAVVLPLTLAAGPVRVKQQQCRRWGAVPGQS